MEILDNSWPFSGGMSYPSNHLSLAQGNRRLILGLICQRKYLSQKNLAAKTGLQPSTVSNIVRDLKASGMVEDGTALKADRVGPKETVLEIVPSCHWSVGISFEDRPRLVVINAIGLIITSTIFPANYSVPKLIQELPQRLEEFAGEWHLDWSRFAGVGVSVAGVVEPQTGMVMLSHSLHEKCYPLKEQMESALNVPVFVERDVVCGAYAERLVGVARDAESFLHLAITDYGTDHVGFGLATVINERIFRGNNSAAGEVDFLMDQFISAKRPDEKEIESADVFYRNCGEGLAAILNLLDIDCLVLACDDNEFTEERFALLKKALVNRLVSIPKRDLNLFRSRLEMNGPVLGAALLILHRRIESDLFAPKREGAVAAPPLERAAC
jgi:transcriptional regulator with XRE-family HTH domain